MKKILYISYDGMTDHLGQSQVLPYLVGLSEKGYKFHLISFEKSETYQKNKSTIQNIADNANIKWIPLNYTKKPPILSTLYDVWKMKRTAKKLHKEFNFDATHCRSYISAFAGIYMKNKFGVKFIFDIRGFWADERVEGGIWNLNNPIFKIVYNFFKRKETLFFNNADYTISLTNAGKEIIHSWGNIKNQPIPIEVIPCCADFDHFKESKNQNQTTVKIKSDFSINNSDFIISYLGSIGTWYMLDEMLDFFKILITYKPNAKFLFITGEAKEIINNKAIEKGIDLNKIIIKKAQRNEVPAYIALSNISIFFIKPIFSKQASSPTKMAEIMGMGIPVICNSNVGDVETIIKDSKTGIVIDKFNDNSYKEAINNINKIISLDKNYIREVAINNFSLNIGINSYEVIYKQLDNTKN